MKRRQILSVGLCALVLALVGTRADAAIIAQWGFEIVTPPDSTNAAANGPHNPDVGIGLASGTHVSVNTDWTTPAGNGSANSYSSNEWAIGDFYQFQVATTGLSGQNLVFEQTRSATGPSSWEAFYSTNGTTFNSLGTYTVPATTWSSVTPDATFGTTFFFPLPGATDNQATLFLRLVAQSAAGGTAGTSRVDNVTVGDVVPEPASMGLIALAAACLMGRRRI
jgi:hypothetical protein